MGQSATPKQPESTGTVTEPQEQLRFQEHNGEDTTQPTRKKSLSFKLAFSGLALVLLVFQVDATCLGIALPVSQDTRPSLRPVHILY